MCDHDDFLIVKNQRGEFVTEGNLILVCCKADRTKYMYVPAGDLGIELDVTTAMEEDGLNEAGLDEDNEPVETEATTSSNVSMNTTSKKRNLWNRLQTKKLIQAYKENRNMIGNTTLRNSKLWKKIATQLEGKFSEIQIERKFRTLKDQYMKKKDNKGQKSSGSARFDFEYFEDLDDIFRADPNVEPIAIASSSGGLSNTINLRARALNESSDEESDSSEIVDNPDPVPQETSADAVASSSSNNTTPLSGNTTATPSSSSSSHSASTSMAISPESSSAMASVVSHSKKVGKRSTFSEILVQMEINRQRRHQDVVDLQKSALKLQETFQKNQESALSVMKDLALAIKNNFPNSQQ